MSTKFNFSLGDNYNTRITDLNDTFKALAKFDPSGASDLETGMFRFYNNKIEQYDGTVWVDYKFDTLYVDFIDEKTSDSGVNIDGVVLKNSSGTFHNVYINSSNPVIDFTATAYSGFFQLLSIDGRLRYYTENEIFSIAQNGNTTFTGNVYIDATAKGFMVDSNYNSSETLLGLKNSYFGTNFSINTAGGVGSYLGGAVAGDVVIRELTSNLLIGTYGEKNVSLATNNNTRMMINSSGNTTFSGNVGINGSKLTNFSTAGKTLTIADTSGTTVPLLEMRGANTGFNSAFIFQHNSSTEAYKRIAQISCYSDTGQDGSIRFTTYDGTNYSDKVILSKDGIVSMSKQSGFNLSSGTISLGMTLQAWKFTVTNDQQNEYINSTGYINVKVNGDYILSIIGKDNSVGETNILLYNVTTSDVVIIGYINADGDIIINALVSLIANNDYMICTYASWGTISRTTGFLVKIR